MEPHWQLLLPGIPITCSRGSLGWCSVSLVRTQGRTVLIDTGSYGDRALLLARLQEAGVRPEAVDDVFLTHFHFDHVLNFDLFENADFHLSEEEIRYVTDGGYRAVGDPYVPAVAYRALAPQIKPFSGAVEILPGLRTLPLPGHTPGMTGLLLQKDGVLFAGDGVKNAREFLRQQPPPAFASPADALSSYRQAAESARIIVPGHDNPFRVPVGNQVDYLARFNIELIFSGNPGAEPQTISLPGKLGRGES